MTANGWRATVREPPRQYHDEEPEMPADSALTSETLSGALAPGGAMARDFNAVWEQLWRQDHVPPRLLELCRLRLAQLLGASAELDAPRGIERDPERIEAVRSGAITAARASTPRSRRCWSLPRSTRRIRAPSPTSSPTA